MVDTTLTRAGARRGSSAAALIPTGKPSAAPMPHATMPTIASHNGPTRPKTARPTSASPAHSRSTATRPNRSSNGVPNIRMAVIAVTKIPNASAPTAWLVRNPSTTDRLAQSLAAPSVSAAASTTSPTSRVRGSAQAASAPRAPRGVLTAGSAARSTWCSTTAVAAREPAVGPATSASGTASVGGSGCRRWSAWPVGRNRRTATATSTVLTTITAGRCATTGTCASAATAATPAAAIVPNEKPAWYRGITVRPSRCSTRAPSRFIEASQTPAPTPTRTSPATTSGTSRCCTPTDDSRKPSAFTTAKVITVRRAPSRSTTMPDSGSDSSEPTEATSSSRPIRSGENPRPSRMAGMRDAQLAKFTPLSVNTAATAHDAARTERSGAGVLIVSSPRGSRASSRIGAAVTRLRST